MLSSSLERLEEWAGGSEDSRRASGTARSINGAAQTVRPHHSELPFESALWSGDEPASRQQLVCKPASGQQACGAAWRFSPKLWQSDESFGTTAAKRLRNLQTTQQQKHQYEQPTHAFKPTILWIAAANFRRRRVEAYWMP